MFWSPDSRYLAFAARGKLKKVEAAGGPVQSLTDGFQNFLGGAWAPDGTILYSTASSGTMRLPDSGGTPVPAIARDPDHPTFTANPSFLPDGRHYIYTFCTEPPNPCSILIRSLDSPPGEKGSKPLVATLYNVRAGDVSSVYAASPDPDFGYILYEREGALMALPFDARRLEAGGPGVPVAEGIGTSSRYFSVSANGVLAFQRSSSFSPQNRLLWFDRRGKQSVQPGPPGPYSSVSLSPDGKFAVIGTSNDGGGFSHDLALDLARGVFTRISPGDNIEYAGTFSPDGRVAFTYTKNGAAGDIYIRSASGAGEPEPLVVSKLLKHPNDWSRDGRWIIYDEHGPQRQDLMVIPASGGKPFPFLATAADESPGAFSPDTHWVAYASDESGRREIYVQGFVPDHVPAAGILKVQISVSGGDKPRWRHDGKEIYYLAPDGKVMAVPVTSTPTTFQPGVAVALFQGPRLIGYEPYDVSPDGRFLFTTSAEETPNPTSPITVVLNWWGVLRK
jgi:Tol biopolymer transport system component